MLSSSFDFLSSAAVILPVHDRLTDQKMRVTIWDGYGSDSLLD